MTGTFYHLDRWDELDPGRTIALREPDSVDGADAAALRSLYPEGLARHGRHYCRQDLYGDDVDDLWDFSCEAVFELVRVAAFPGRPSRFQSVFGFETIAAVERFVERFVDEPCTVWAVEAERAFVGDMLLVDAEDLADGLRRAYSYWRGESPRDDPLWEALLVPPVTVVEAVERGFE